MSEQDYITVDGNEAVARIAHAINDILAIYPITPASPMGELSDAYSAKGQPNLWGAVPQVVEMQSEAGAAGVLHGALQAGALCSTFTSSQGLLLMIPTLYKVAGELTPAVFHIASRTVATHALSIFCDHSDVMSCRGTGVGMLFSNSVQEAHDGALISQMISMRTRIPFLHIFDGFRTSHEVSKIAAISEAQMRALFPWQEKTAHEQRGLNPENPVIRGTSQNPDVFFQSRERANPVYEEAPTIAQACFDDFFKVTGRRYQPAEYVGSAEAEQIIVLMGSGAETAEEAVNSMVEEGRKVGLVKIRLFRPFDAQSVMSVIPDSVKAITVLDRTKEPGAEADPLMLDITHAAHLCERQSMSIHQGRYGLSSKEFTPSMVRAVFDNMRAEVPLNGFTVGIEDDLQRRSLLVEDNFRTNASQKQHQAVFYGLGADGTVSANKNSIKILGENTDWFGQGYFEYDSKKSGAVTVSHLRFAEQKIHSTYLIESDMADFVACHQFSLLERFDVMEKAKFGAVFLLNAPFEADQVWSELPASLQTKLQEKQCKFYVIDAYKLAKELGLGKRINTIMQSCFFAISEYLPQQKAVTLMQDYARKTYAKAGAPRG